MKKLYIIFCLSLLANILLATYLIRVKPVCERYHISEINYSYDVVSDEATAREISDVIEAEYIGHGDMAEYDVVVDFNNQSNEWEVIYVFNEIGGLTQKDIVCIRKDNGMITTYRRICWEGDKE